MAQSKKKKASSNRISNGIGSGKKKSVIGNGNGKKKTAAGRKPPLKTGKPKTVADADAVTDAVFRPIDDRVLIAVEAASETTAGGIIIPGNVDSRPNRGLILAKGPGRKSKKGKIRPLDVNVGDRVLFPEFAGTKIEIGGEDFLILREEELLGIVT